MTLVSDFELTLGMKLLTNLLLVILSPVFVFGSDCVRLGSDEATREGYSETIVFNEKETRGIVTGTVVFNLGNRPVEDVFVEAFLLNKDAKAWNRVAGCRTDDTGKFAFIDLPKGKYKIVLSKDGGWKITEILVKVDPKSGNKAPIVASVEVGA